MKIFESKFTKEELKPLKNILLKGQLGFGPNVLEFEKQFQSFSGKKYNTATNSASAAAFIIFAYLKEKYGVCDVYTPSLAFTSPAWAAKHFDHNIIWVDIDNNLLMDINDYKEKRRLRCERYSDGGVKPVLMPILYGGVSTIPGFENIHDDGYKEIVVADSAHCVTPTIKSDFTFFSFHATKPISSSDGGMISTDDLKASKYFQNYKNFGRQNLNNSYNIIQEGFKFYMNNLNATIALISLKKYQKDLKTRKSNYTKLRNVLPHDESSSYYFATQIRDDAKKFNKKNQNQVHYPLLHKTQYHKKNKKIMFSDEPFYDHPVFLEEKNIDVPNTERLYPKIVNLPLYKKITL